MITLCIDRGGATPRLLVQLHVASCGRRIQQTRLTIDEARQLHQQLTQALEILCRPSAPSAS